MSVDFVKLAATGFGVRLTKEQAAEVAEELTRLRRLAGAVVDRVIGAYASELREGKVRKGGQNLTYQITERPPDPPPMRSGFFKTTGRVTFEPMAALGEHVLRTRDGRIHCAWCGAECQPDDYECWHCKTALLPLTVPGAPPCPTCGGTQQVGTGHPSDEGGEAYDRCPDCA